MVYLYGYILCTYMVTYGVFIQLQCTYTLTYGVLIRFWPTLCMCDAYVDGAAPSA